LGDEHSLIRKVCPGDNYPLTPQREPAIVPAQTARGHDGDVDRVGDQVAK